ncbi:hypothetical protein Nepgr_016920 [Nepenthes gracilis]|uniref:Uncharacterized protein n=1 Tax=Nepenthes gracilis TaxID=150966 RepID=A0AAD3SQL2_NEPGR|nr:hypothetical protein Nepgr_016920 [Nepenthes gracilis]
MHGRKAHGLESCWSPHKEIITIAAITASSEGKPASRSGRQSLLPKREDRPLRTTLLVSWSTGPRAEYHRLTFSNWWSRCRPTMACFSYFAHRTSNDNKWLHQQPFLLLPPRGVARGRRSRPRGSERLETIWLQHPPTVLARTGLWNALGERASKIARSTGGSSRPAAEPASDKTELRDYLNSKRLANIACTDPRVDKIWNCVFQEEEHAIDLDRSPFTAEILSRPPLSKFKMPPLTYTMGAVIRLTTWITSAPI